MSSAKRTNEETASRMGYDRRVYVVFLAALYGSVVATLIGLYFAATRLGQLSALAALSLVGLCGALVLGTMLPITVRSLRVRGGDEVELREDSRRWRIRPMRIVGAACLALLAVGLMMAGLFEVAALAAIFSVALIHNVTWRPKE